MISFNCYQFSDLTIDQLYSILALRSEVFVVEQNCAYQDMDGKDLSALHLLGMENNSLAAYLRIFPPATSEDFVVFGRLVTSNVMRKKGYGKKLMQELLNCCNTYFSSVGIKCSAQHYLKHFYESFGFKAYGEIYLEDGIPHIAMMRNS